MIDRIASDLGVCRYAEEPLSQYQCRVIYSAMACWMKAIALDRPIGYHEDVPPGISRRHINERSHTILEMMIKMFPNTKEWFDLSSENEDPVNLIRTRLINHGDLLNAGFGTNLALSSVHSNQISSTIETVYGKTIDEDLHYSGVSAIRRTEERKYFPETKNVKEWLKCFLNDASWSHDLPQSNQMQYFNPQSTAKNNFAAWQDSIARESGKIALVRTIVNKNGYSYYLLKPDERLIHKIDPFLQEQGFHIRVMCALRSLAKNNTTVSVTRYYDHISVRFNAILPLQESTLMESYAWPVRRINDKLVWVMSHESWSCIRPYIEALDILVAEVEHG